ncbi:secretory phospholipase A2 receptor [Amblyraja radiata]|uniref:secretory phospholipase A2 receptor n=1 Tax=Amblyraja radiata TaxID=386614 RepID=UPI0014036CC3|nr:secretory phospholipase A2 receptor [Amblyraja radiata]
MQPVRTLHRSGRGAALVTWVLLCSSCTHTLSSFTSVVDVRRSAPNLDQGDLSELLGKNIFILQSEHLDTCINVEGQDLRLDDCSQPSRSMLWKWVSKHRLFHLVSSSCLGLEINDQQRPLKLFSCDSATGILQWHCTGKVLAGASKYKLAVGQGHRVVAERTIYDRWRRYMTQDEGPCKHLYEEIHTVLGTSRGMPCALPFKYNNKWYHECTDEGREDKLLWCATTSNYDVDEQWGFCPNLDTGCDLLWEKDPVSQTCYQFDLFALQSWNVARASCKAQGGDLLAIRDHEQQEYLKKRLQNVGILAWIGLNHLDEDSGWQWADRAPLSFVNWDAEQSPVPLFETHHCGTLNSKLGFSWSRAVCETALPYICEKTLNSSRKVNPFEFWQYRATRCEPDWLSHNGFCYKIHKEIQGWKDALASCRENGSELVGVHSLADVGSLMKLFMNETVSEVWTGLYNNRTPAEFTWSEESPVTFTYWHKNEPNFPYSTREHCVSLQTINGQWKVKDCQEKMWSICKKPGKVEQQGKDKGCLEEWKRYDDSCYHIDTYLQTFDEASKGYLCTLASIENRFEHAFIDSLISNFAREKNKYFWIGLQDRNRTGEYTWLTTNNQKIPVTFTNWNKDQPAYSGGCVALVREKSHILWEVKDCKTFKALPLCEDKVASSVKVDTFPDPTMKANNKCHFGWESRSDLHNCFKVFHREKVLRKRTWEEAEQFCQAFGAHLASFNHYSEEVFLNEILGWMFAREDERWFWIGFNKRNPTSAGSWKWSDGSSVVSLFSLDKDKNDDLRICAAYRFDKTLAPFQCDEKLGWVCKMPKGTELKKADWYVDEEQLAFAPWFFFQGAEYLFFETEGKWLAAVVACSLMGSNLVSITTQKEQNFIQNRMSRLLANGHEKWWIGLYAENPKTGFRWTDDSPLYYNNWDVNYPSLLHKRSGRCVYLSAKTGRWGDSKCFLSLPFICKRHNISLVEVPTVDRYLPDISCPKGWLYFENKCFLVYVPKDKRQLKHWYSSQMFCTIHGGNLATIENEIEQAFLTIQLLERSTSVWIGLHSDNFERWVNGKPVKYTNWLPNEPARDAADPYDPTSEHNNSPVLQEEAKRCALLSNSHAHHSTGRWYTSICNTNRYGFVCQKAPDTSIHNINKSSVYQIPDTFAYGNYTYKLLKKNVTWYEALNECKLREAELVSITDQYHQAFLTVIVNTLAHSHWIGLSSQDDGHSFAWSDGSAVVFTQWSAERPHSSHDCGYMDTKGYWRTADCETRLQGAVCQVLETATLNPPAHKAECPNLDEGLPWIPFRGNCYLFDLVLYNSSSLTMEEAKDICGNLAAKSFILHINDEEENNFILQQVKLYSHIANVIWLGIMFDNNDNTLKWLDGTPITYSNWGAEEPNAHHLSIDFCAGMRSTDGTWFLTNCAESLAAVCQTDLSGNAYIPKQHEYQIGNTTVLTTVLALLVTLVIVVGAVGAWYLWRRNRPSLRFAGNAYYRQSAPEVTDDDGNILISAFEKNGGN